MEVADQEFASAKQRSRRDKLCCPRARGPILPLTYHLGRRPPATPGILPSVLRPSCRRWPTMPSIRVKTSRSFYKTIEEETPASPAPPRRRTRSKSVIEAFSGDPALLSPNLQSPRPQSYAPNLRGARLSRVSQQISNSSREALPGPSVDQQYRGSNAFDDNAGMWDEDQTEAVIDHLDVIGAQFPFLLRRMPRVNVPLVDPQVATMSSLTNAANSIVMYVVTHGSWVLN